MVLGFKKQFVAKIRYNLEPITRETTDEIFERYTKDDFVMDKTRFWQAVNQLRIESNRLEKLVMPKDDYVAELEAAIKNTVEDYDHILNMNHYPQLEDFERWIRDLRESIHRPT
uniref:Uncharacterized protein n=1 Tax=viral metagenome TaxID=1070528 RepID=A0A6M3JJT4_9ZZZZ